LAMFGFRIGEDRHASKSLFRNKTFATTVELLIT
jgi:hypothetical protein